MSKKNAHVRILYVKILGEQKCKIKFAFLFMGKHTSLVISQFVSSLDEVLSLKTSSVGNFQIIPHLHRITLHSVKCNSTTSTNIMPTGVKEIFRPFTSIKVLPQ